MFESRAVMPLVLADQIGQYITLAVLVLTFLSWFVRLLKGNDGGAAAQAAPPRRPREKELRTEIEVFLQELTKPEPARAAEPVRPPAPPRKPSAPPRPKVKGEKPRKTRPGDAPIKNVERPRPGSSLAQQHLPSSQLGQGVRTHLSEYMTADRVTAEAQQHVGHRIDQAVQQDLGVSAAIVSPPRAGVTRHPLVALLSEPGGVRQAFVLNEVLQKPRALRGSQSRR
jgi:hypothetical protein